MGQIGMLTFKDSVAFLASQLCRNRQVMSFAKVESWMDADPDPVIDTKNQKHLLCHTRLHTVKLMQVQNQVPSCYAKWFTLICFHASMLLPEIISFRLSSLDFIT